MLTSRYLTEEELKEVGFAAYGHNVRINNTVLIYGAPSNITLGNNVRIDAYTVLSSTGKLAIGSNIHIGEFCFLGAGNGIELQDFSGLSQSVKIYSGSDDYSGSYMTNPTIPRKYLGGVKGKVTVSRHVIIGSGSVVLPKVTIGEGCSIGAQSLVTKTLAAWGVYFGSPAKFIKPRSKKLLDLESNFLLEQT